MSSALLLNLLTTYTQKKPEQLQCLTAKRFNVFVFYLKMIVLKSLLMI